MKTWLDTVYSMISHPGFWAILVVFILLVSLVSRYSFLVTRREIFRVISADFLKALSILGVAIITYLITHVFEWLKG
jgi:ABC-type microcin C transport system permease subunit YejE